jgi:hypothetical protein
MASPERVIAVRGRIGVGLPMFLVAVAAGLLAAALISCGGGGGGEGGGQIAFASNRDGNWEIYLMNADGSGAINLTQNAAQHWQPVWSPDGTRLAFESERSGSAEVCVMKADGSGQRNLTRHAAADNRPRWRPEAVVASAPLGGALRCAGRSAAGWLPVGPAVSLIPWPVRLP